MPYSIRLPDGTLVRNIPDDLPPEEAKQRIIAAGLVKAPAPAESTIMGELVRGGKQLASSVRTGIESVTSPEEAALAGVERGKKIEKEAGEGPSFAAVKKAYEERGLLPAAGEAISQIPRALAGQGAQLAAMAGGARLGATAGSALGSVVPGVGTVAGGIAGGVLGAGATLLPQFMGSNVERQAKEQLERGEPVSIDRTKAYGAAAGQAALEGAGTAFTLGKRFVKGVLGIADDAALATAKASAKAQQELAKAAQRSVVAAAGHGALHGLVEIPVEIAQAVLERAQAGLDLMSPEAFEEYGENAYLAGLVGPTIGGAAGVHGRRAARAAQAAQPAPGTLPGETPIERAERLAAEKAAAKVAEQPAAPPVPAPAPAPGEIPAPPPVAETPAPPPVAETPAPPPIEEPKVKKPGEPPAGGMQPADIEALGISKKQPIYRRMLGKDLENPEQRAAVLADIENYLTRGNGSEESRIKLAEFKAKFAPAEAVTPAPPPVVEAAAPAVPPVEAPVGGAPAVETAPTTPPVVEAPSVPSVSTEPEAGGAGAPVVSEPSAGTATEGVGAVEPTGVVRPVADVEQPAGRERAAPAPVAPEFTEADIDRAVETGLLTEEQAEVYRAELREEEAPPTAMAAAFQKQIDDIEAQMNALKKNGRAPAKKTPARAKYDALKAQLESLQTKETGDLAKRLEKMGASGVVGTRGERPVIDLDAVRENLIKARAAPKMYQAVLNYIGVDADGNYLPTTYSREDAAEMAGLGRGSGANVSRVAQSMGITADVVSRFHAGQTDIIVLGKNVSEAGTGATDLQPTRGVLYEPKKGKNPTKAVKFLSPALTDTGELDFTKEKITDKQLAEIYARASNYDPSRGGNLEVIKKLNEEIAARTKADRKGMQAALDRAYRVVRAEEETAAEQETTAPETAAPDQVVTEEEAFEEPEFADATRRLSDEDVEYRTIPQSPVVTNRASHAELEKVVAEIEKALGGKVDVTILDDVTDVDAKQKPGSRAGATIKGGIYLFRSGIAKGIEGQKTIFHELFHKGLKNLLPEAEYRAAMNRFYSQSAEIRAMADAYLASDVGKQDTKNLSPQDARMLAVEESLAEVAEQTDLKPTMVRQVGNFLARVADRLGMPQLARAIRTMGLNEQEKFIRDALQAGMGPSKAGEGAARFRPGTSAFKRWFGDSKVVDENGKPLVVYHGTVRDFSTFDAARAGQATGHRTAGWGFFFSASPQIAEIFAGRQTKLVSKPEWAFTTPEGLDKLRVVFGLKPKNVRRVLAKEAEFEDTFSKGSNLMSTYLSIQNPKELSAEKFIERFVEGTESAQRFIEQAKKEGHDGVVIRAGRSGKYKFEGSEYAADAWVAFRPEQIKSTTGNVGAYGQRSITKEEAERFGMTQEEAAEAQAAGDIRFRSITAQTEAAVKGVDVIGEKERQTLTQRIAQDLKGNPALKLRVKFTDSLAAMEDFFVNAYGGQIRTAAGRLNPMVLISRALDASRVSKAAQEQGGLGFDSGLIVATELKNAEGQNISYQGVMGRIAEAAKDRGETYEQFRTKVDTVLYGHREYNLREKNKTLAPDEQVELLLSDPEIDKLEAAFQQDDFIKGVLSDLDTIRFNLLDTLVKAGRISEEQAQDYKDAIGYIPFSRIGEYENAWAKATQGANRGVAALKNIRKLEGSEERKTTSVTENFSQLMDWGTKEAMKNDAGLRALKDMVLMGAAFKRPNKPKTDSPGGMVTVFDGGKPVSFYVPDPAHLVTFSIADPQLSNVLKAFQRGSQVLRAGVTSLPPFAIKQVFDDIVRAYTYAGVKNNAALVKSVMLNFPKNWVNEIFKKKPADIKALEGLGIVGTFDFTQQGNLKNILEEAGAKKETLGSSIMRVMEAGAKASDLAVRQAIYNQVLKETGDKAQAESAAREIINFSRRGSSKIMGQMISIIPFFNAYARGMDKLATAAAGGIVGQATGAARSMFYKRMGVLTAMGLAYALMMQDDDDYQNLPDHVRDTNWVLPHGKELGFTPVIPIPAELAFFFKAIPERIVRYYKLHGTQEEQAAIDVLGNLTSRGIDVFSSPNITPQILRPFYENIANYSFFLGRPLESQAQQALRPFERYGTGTSDAMKAVAKGLENVANTTGIEAIAISPIKLENAIRGIFGTAAGLTLSMADMMVNPGRTDRPIHQQLGSQLTGLSTVAKDPIGTRNLDAIYDLEKRVEQVNGTVNRLMERKPEDVDQFIKDNIGLYAIRGSVQTVMSNIRVLNQAAMAIDRDTSMKPDERRKQIDQLRIDQNNLAQQAMMLRKVARDIQMGR